MSAALQVPWPVISQAEQTWDKISDELAPAWKRLARTSTAGLSGQVAAAVVGFREPWVDEIKACAGRAETYYGDFQQVRSGFVMVDHAAAETVRALLPFEYHDSPIFDQ